MRRRIPPNTRDFVPSCTCSRQPDMPFEVLVAAARAARSHDLASRDEAAANGLIVIRAAGSDRCHIAVIRTASFRIEVRPMRRRPAKTLADFDVCGEGISPAASPMSTAADPYATPSGSPLAGTRLPPTGARAAPQTGSRIVTERLGPRRCHLPRVSGQRRNKNFMSGTWFLSTVSGPPNACWRGRTQETP